MLTSLHISNYALIDEIDIDFHSGLNIITGETGAGKSIMLGALGLLLGGRADTRVVRNRERKSVIEAIFDVSRYGSLKAYCRDNDVEWDEGQCILRREISPNGRSRAFINDSPVTLTQIENVGRQLIDIHSQHQNQLLQNADYQLQVIDSLAANGELLQEYGRRYKALREAAKRLAETRERLTRNKADEEFLRFQLVQIDELKLVDGEQEELEKQRDLLANMTQVKDVLGNAIQALWSDQQSALTQLKKAVDACEELTSVLDGADTLAERLESARVEIQDVAETLNDFDADLQADPGELEQVEERLNAIYALERRHHVDTVGALLAIAADLRMRLDAVENADSAIEELQREVKRCKALARETAQQISERRKKEGEALAETLTATAMPLGMKNLQVKVSVQPADMTATGMDRVEFLFAFNKNQQLTPVGGAASGGEISRLMLSLKSIIARKMQLPSVIFDEVDTGVSGDVANRMGVMMKEMSANLQVITITHLPQVAAKGEWHSKVFKEDDDEATRTRIRTLSDDERVAELALMLSGDAKNAAAIANAKELLQKQ